MYIGKRTLAATKWKKQIPVDEWAEKYFVLEESSAVGGGKYNFSHAPALRLPLRAFGYDNISNITYWFASQMGKSTISYIAINYITDRLTGSNIGFYLPNDSLVPYTASNRIIPSIKRVPSNAKIMSETKANSKLKDNTKIIRLGGGVLRVMGAESSSNRKSFPAQYIFMDEIAEFKEEYVLEVEERNKTYADYGGKIVKLSTSLHSKDSIVLSHNRAECQMEYFVKCPKCGKSHVDDFLENIVIREDFEVPEHITKKEDIEVYKASMMAKTATYKCPKCQAHWDTDTKNKAIDIGGWKAVRGDINKDSSVSFRASSFVSKFVSIEALVKKWLDVKDATDELKTKFYNGWLSKIYEPKIETLPSEEIWKLKSEIPHEKVPDNTIGLVGAIDVQKDHYYGIVIAVDEDMNRRITEYTRIESATDLEMFILMPRYKVGGDLVNVEAWAIDSGYNSNEIYNFCYDMNTLHNQIPYDETVAKIYEKRGGEAVNCIPVRGSSRSTSSAMFGKSQITTLDKDINGKVFDDTLKLHVINTYMFADISMKMIKDTIKKVDAGEPLKNCLTIHSGMDGDIVRALTSEQKVELPNGQYQYVPVKAHPFNHYWDCLKYANYLIDKMGVRHRELISNATPMPSKEDEQRRLTRRRDRYSGNWRDAY